MYVLILFIVEMFSALSAVLFARPGFRFFCARLAVYYLAIYSVLGS